MNVDRRQESDWDIQFMSLSIVFLVFLVILSRPLCRILTWAFETTSKWIFLHLHRLASHYFFFLLMVIPMQLGNQMNT